MSKIYEIGKKSKRRKKHQSDQNAISTSGNKVFYLENKYFWTHK